jgi:ABC-2 type transport system permease protein
VSAALRDLRHASHAEWTKLRTVPGNLWLLAAAATATVALGTMVTASVHTDQCPSPSECFEDTTRLSLSGVHLGQLAVIVLAALAVCGEYGSGMIRVTFVAMPRRLGVFATRAAVVVIGVLVAGAVGVVGSVGAARPILHRNGFTDLLPPGSGPALRAALGTVLYLGLIALLTFGVSALVRDAATAIAGVIGLLYLAPILAQFIDSDLVETYAPLSAGLAVQTTLFPEQMPIGGWAGLGVLAAWAGAAIIAGGARFVRDDP